MGKSTINHKGVVILNYHNIVAQILLKILNVFHLKSNTTNKCQRLFFRDRHNPTTQVLIFPKSSIFFKELFNMVRSLLPMQCWIAISLLLKALPCMCGHISQDMGLKSLSQINSIS